MVNPEEWVIGAILFVALCGVLVYLVLKDRVSPG